MSDLHEFSDRLATHLFHHLRPMRFDGALGCVQFGGNLLVHPSGNHAFKNLKFERRKSAKTSAPFSQSFTNNAIFRVTSERLVNGFEQILALDWLGEKINRSCLHGPYGRPNVPVA